MVRRFVGWSPVVAGILMWVLPMLSHHVIAAKFDPSRPRTLSGIVTKVDWANPHVHVLINVRERDQWTNWAVELDSSLELERSAWTRDSVKPGDSVTVQGPVARDGSLQIWGESFTLTRTGQKVLGMSPAGLAYFRPVTTNTPANPTPRWPDGQPRLGPAPGETGYWGRPSSRALKENGVNVEIGEDGMLKNINDAAKVAPFQPWARDLYVFRQREFLRNDPMYLECYPAGAVRQFQIPFGVQFVEDRNFNRIFVMNGGGNHDWHYIYTDGREPQGNIRGNADNPLYYGNARGRWQGDTLVVDSSNFNEKFWFGNGGLPHTQQLKLVERFTRTDKNTLRYEVTIEDPGAYTRPWTASWTLQWVAGDELPVYYCQDNRA
jgi:Family of unknown function (DUF6152)